MAKIINITRNRDRYDITVVTEGKPEKHAYYDISTNEKIGISGKAVQSLRYDEGILLNILMGYYMNAQVREFCDRLISLPFFDLNKKNYICRNGIASWNIPEEIKIILDNWKEFLEYAKADEIGQYFSTYITMKKRSRDLDWIQDEEIKQMILHRSFDYVNAFITLANKYKSFRKALNQQINRKIKIDLNRQKVFDMLGVNEETLASDYGFRCYDVKSCVSDKIYSLMRDYEWADKMMTDMQITDYEITDIKAALRDLQSMKEGRENELFAARQKNANLEYENDEFKIFVPTSRGDLAKYGSYFNNCLNGHEWNCYLSDGARYAVIVIDKTIDRPVICVDIDCKDRKIHQYLKQFNRCLGKNDTRYRAFRTEYQQYLQKVNN